VDKLVPAAQAILDELLEGNRRFVDGEARPHSYSQEELRGLAAKQNPKVAIIACSDSRTSPDIVFDQPLGTVFASRVPGNVASDSAKWMLEIALGEFRVPLVLVMGHSGCLAVGQLLDGDKGGAGGIHRFSVSHAVYRAKAKNPDDLYRAALEENVKQTCEHLVRDLYILRSALLDGQTSIIGAIYEMETGAVRLVDVNLGVYARF